MKLTKKARAFLKEADKVAPLLSKECIICKHHNPNHLLLINEEEGHKIICKKCLNPKENEGLTDSTSDPSLEEKINENIEFKVRVGEIKLEKTKKIKKVTKRSKKISASKEKELVKDSTENIAISNLTATHWNLAYGPTPKNFKGMIWLAESPDPIPVKVYTDDNGTLHKVYYFKSI